MLLKHGGPLLLPAKNLRHGVGLLGSPVLFHPYQQVARVVKDSPDLLHAGSKSRLVPGGSPLKPGGNHDASCRLHFSPAVIRVFQRANLPQGVHHGLADPLHSPCRRAKAEELNPVLDRQAGRRRHGHTQGNRNQPSITLRESTPQIQQRRCGPPQNLHAQRVQEYIPQGRLLPANVFRMLNLHLAVNLLEGILPPLPQRLPIGRPRQHGLIDFLHLFLGIKCGNPQPADAALDGVPCPGYPQECVKAAGQRLVISRQVHAPGPSLLARKDAGQVPYVPCLLRVFSVRPNSTPPHLVAKHEGTHIGSQYQRIDTGRIPALSQQGFGPDQRMDGAPPEELGHRRHHMGGFPLHLQPAIARVS